MNDIVKLVSAVIIDRGWIFLVRKDGIYIPPGGKPNPGESDEDCLRREIRKELSGTEIGNLTPYKSFRGRSISGSSEIEAMIYFTNIEGKLGKPSAEIEKYSWIHKDSLDRWPFSEATKKMIDSLKFDRLF